MSSAYSIRNATAADLETIVALTVREAQEAEGFQTSETVVRRGVAGAFEDPPVATYWVAEAAGEVVASISVVREWSNFRGDNYWWIQSLYVVPEHRSTGLVDLLIEHVARVAQANGALDLRLYVHGSNVRAQQVYRRRGFVDAPYLMMSRRWLSPDEDAPDEGTR